MFHAVPSHMCTLLYLLVFFRFWPRLKTNIEGCRKFGLDRAALRTPAPCRDSCTALNRTYICWSRKYANMNRQHIKLPASVFTDFKTHAGKNHERIKTSLDDDHSVKVYGPFPNANLAILLNIVPHIHTDMRWR